MKSDIANGLISLGIFKKYNITKSDYEAEANKNSRYIIYKTTNYTYNNGKKVTGDLDETGLVETTDKKIYYGRVDTQNLTTEEINLLLNIDKANSLRSIKKGATFFVVLSVISIIISIIGAVNMASLY